ncbi:hypothetical protein RZA67_09985 [Stenotrophomonas sp. C3(2023)]|uniref:hypothetical protein n=1 Tax=Stenotrophomonas sp. C3(2023) TaxID=3080277 RepID=UPI00293CB6AB|nr:hypothetical protein [Stenotrophomonas sp. C3(2023)]MDV3469058.1 hypothetical protein [Stenotrophomonas sp. C3(2023)]
MSKERPILFNGAMVRAILSGAKTQTRRLCKDMNAWVDQGCREVRDVDGVPHHFLLGAQTPIEKLRCPFGQPGERLWVRENWARVPSTAYRCSTGVEQAEDPEHPGMAAVYAAGWERSNPGRWRPSIHMPRWACRLVLEITDVRVERLQAISEADAITEGLTQMEIGGWLPGPCDHPEWAFHQLWNQVYGESAWDSNPWVWVIHFKRVEVSGV